MLEIANDQARAMACAGPTRCAVASLAKNI